MKNDQDKKLDDLFREKLENPDHQAGYREEDWDTLEDMLDKQKKSKGMIYLLPILSGAAAVLLLLGGWWLFQHNTTRVQKNSSVAAIHPETIKTNADTIAQSEQAARVSQAIPAEAINVVKTNKRKTGIDNIQKSPSILTLTASSAGKAKDSVKRSLLVNNKPAVIKPPVIINSIPGVNNWIKIQQPDNMVSITKPENTQLAGTTSNNKIKISFPVVPAIVMPPASNLVIASSHAPEKPGLANTNIIQQPLSPTEKSSLAMNQLLANTSVADNKINNRLKASLKSRFVVSVLGAQDINGAGSFQQSKVGTKAGILFSVGASRKLTVSTGALYSNTPYEAGYDQYHFPYQFKNPPSSVTANCQMLDIPLNIAYQVYHKNRDMFSVGTGLSSYLMLQEQYAFNYSGGGASGPAKYSVPNPDNYLFKILNLSASYEHQINSKAGITVQPYLKLPLADIGYSQVKLQTTGVAIGLTYKLSSSKP